jgi:hypothetical protein
MIPEWLGNGTAVQLDQPACKLACGGHTDLLAKHGADGNLESIPSARSTQTRSQCNESGERWVQSEMLLDRLDVCPEIEQPSQARDDGR